MGNHDGECFYNEKGIRVEKGWAYKDKEYLIGAKIFEDIQETMWIRWTNPWVFISHYAHRTWPDQGKGTIHLYGHSHLNLDIDPDVLSMDI